MAWNVVIKNSHQEQSITVTVSITSCHGILKYHCIIQASKHPNLLWITQKHSSKCWGHSNMGTLTHNSLKKRTYDTRPTSSRARKQPLDRFSVHSPRPTPHNPTSLLTPISIPRTPPATSQHPQTPGPQNTRNISPRALYAPSYPALLTSLGSRGSSGASIWRRGGIEIAPPRWVRSWVWW